MAKKRLKILSYNIHKGFNLTRKFMLENVRKAIRSTGADLVFLQEVLGRHEKHEKKIPSWPEKPQFEFLADEIWKHHAYGENAVYTSGHHGNAILSKFPFRAQENVDISMSRFAKRGLLYGAVQVPGLKEDLHVVCLHFDLRESERKMQVELVADFIEDRIPGKAPLIVAGDFNDWREKTTNQFAKLLSLEEAFMKKHKSHARTFPAPAAALKLDRVYYRGFEVKKAERFSKPPWNQLSDHLALYVELQIET